MSSHTAGSIYPIELDTTHALAFGMGNYFYLLKRQAALYETLKAGGNVGVIKKEAYGAGLLRDNLQPIIKQGLSFGVQRYGWGSIVYFSDDPIFRGFWENGKMLFCNAIFLVGQHPK